MRNSRIFDPGFRMSILDGVVLVAGAAGVAFAAKSAPELAMAIGFTVGHFFLFCNLIRMRRVSELAWAAAFLALSTLSSFSNLLAWGSVFAAASVMTVVLVVIELRSPSYHGIFWWRVNPSLESWWNLDQGPLS